MTSQALPPSEQLRTSPQRRPDVKTLPRDAITCPRCGNWWTGLISCHCGACHCSFTGIGAFDIHRRGGKCVDPETILTKTGEPALIPANKPWPGWSQTGTWDGPR